MTHTKMRYDGKIALLQEETQAAQTQLEKARRERDTLRQVQYRNVMLNDDLKRNVAIVPSCPVRAHSAQWLQTKLSAILFLFDHMVPCYWVSGASAVGITLRL